ncbi:hypothetical protein [Oceanospirillum maris]|uniref:hypothetical protein n=1 Tax=Oceanospirillum maris TaxID=64977 RepID=UPI00041AA556|nr:hypothetical protein [Oceanospirillum maris]
MSFVLAPKEIVKTVVKAVEPLDFGKKQTHTLEVHWKVLSVAEIRDYQERLKDGGTTDEELIQELVVDIPGVKDPSGAEIPFGKDLVHQLMNVEYVRKAFTEELTNMLFGKDFMKRVREKN